MNAMNAVSDKAAFLAPVAESPAMKEVIAAAEDVAPTPTTVLLLGESGTGKEVVARHIHRGSNRATGPWVAVNCAALPSELLESELFGHERGSFTGAVDRKIGRIEQAHGGTLLLDELSELPLPLQAKLLRVLQERELDRIGGLKPIPVDVRIIAASNRDLGAMVAQKRFRADLYYRLNVFPIRLPPLRRRKEDIKPLSELFLKRLAAVNRRPVPQLTAAALGLLEAYAFPGNVRELGNLLERAFIRGKGSSIFVEQLELPSLTVRGNRDDLEPGAADWPQATPLNLAALERLAISEALRRVNGNRTHAARLLGIGLRTLRNKLRLMRTPDDAADSAERQELPVLFEDNTSLSEGFISEATARLSQENAA